MAGPVSVLTPQRNGKSSWPFYVTKHGIHPLRCNLQNKQTKSLTLFNSNTSSSAALGWMYTVGAGGKLLELLSHPGL